MSDEIRVTSAVLSFAELRTLATVAAAAHDWSPTCKTEILGQRFRPEWKDCPTLACADARKVLAKLGWVFG